jgi:hypothetical protein
LKAIENFKRFDRGYKPRPALELTPYKEIKIVHTVI